MDVYCIDYTRLPAMSATSSLNIWLETDEAAIKNEFTNNECDIHTNTQ